MDLQALYSPGYYHKGEELCSAILENYDPDHQPALQFLVLSLAAQDAEDEALELVEHLDIRSHFLVLKNLPFGCGTNAESALYQATIESACRLGMKEEIAEYLDQGILPSFLADQGLQFEENVVESIIDELSY